MVDSIKINGYCTYDKLKTCIVGKTYSKEQFKELKNQKVKDILFKILDETEEDYLNLCKVKDSIYLFLNY